MVLNMVGIAQLQILMCSFAKTFKRCDYASTKKGYMEDIVHTKNRWALPQLKVYIFNVAYGFSLKMSGKICVKLSVDHCVKRRTTEQLESIFICKFERLVVGFNFCFILFS